ncbi:hypothetical protein [Paenibacillus ginsengarvi]|nr:hypothetical protein [Paenibacillus ginsengarvi]
MKLLTGQPEAKIVTRGSGAVLAFFGSAKGEWRTWAFERGK